MMNFYEGKKVLIPGGAGMSGQALTRKLIPLGAEITATEWKSRKIDTLCRSAINIVTGIDLRTSPASVLADLYAGQDVVFYCAALVGGSKAIRDNPSELIHYNLEMAAKNIKAAVDAKVKRFCYTSSSYVYPDIIISAREEDMNLGDVPLVHYGLGWIKRYMETLCRHHHLTSETGFSLARPTALYGPNDDFDLDTCHALPAFIRKFIEGPFPVEVWGTGNERRQYTFIDDFAEGLLRLVELFSVCEPINIASAEVTSIAELVEKICRLTGHYGNLAQSAFANDYRFIGDGPTAIKDRLVDISKAKRLLGFECKTSLETGLKRTIEWFKSQQAI